MCNQSPNGQHDPQLVTEQDANGHVKVYTKCTWCGLET